MVNISEHTYTHFYLRILTIFEDRKRCLFKRVVKLMMRFLTIYVKIQQQFCNHLNVQVFATDVIRLIKINLKLLNLSSLMAYQN